MQSQTSLPTTSLSTTSDTPDARLPDGPAQALVVEDHPLYRDALTFLLGSLIGDENVLSACNAEDGLRLAADAHALRVVLLDMSLSGLCGAEAVAAMHDACPTAALIVVSACEDRRQVMAAFRAGAHLFASKATSTEVLARHVRLGLAGRLPHPPLWIGADQVPETLPGHLPRFTPRQRQILTLLSQGHSNKEIGLRLMLAEKTIKMHLSAIFRTLDVTNRTQAVLTARRWGLQEAVPENAESLAAHA